MRGLQDLTFTFIYQITVERGSEESNKIKATLRVDLNGERRDEAAGKADGSACSTS